MGERGPARKPTALRVLEGDRSHKAPNRREPKPIIRADVPHPPKHLEAIARATWERLAPELHRMGLLTDVDLELFESYCVANGERRLAMAGGHFATMDQAVSRMLTISKRFGFTPADRAGIKGPEVTDDEEARLDRPVRIGAPRPLGSAHPSAKRPAVVQRRRS